MVEIFRRPYLDLTRASHSFFCVPIVFFLPWSSGDNNHEYKDVDEVHIRRDFCDPSEFTLMLNFWTLWTEDNVEIKIVLDL